MSASWRQQRERSNLFWLVLIHRIALRLGRRATRVLLVPIVGYFLLTAGATRRHARDYWRRVSGRPGRWPDLARQLFAFATVILDRLYIYSGRHDGYHLEIHGDALFDSLIAEGRGAILMTAHVGSFDAMRIAAARRSTPLPVKVLMNLEVGRVLVGFLRRLDARLLDNVIDSAGPTTALAFRVRDALADGHMVGIMADRLVDPREPAVPVRFLGEELWWPATPWLLAGALGVPVIFSLCLYAGGDRYELHFESQVAGGETVPRVRRRQFAAEQAQDFADRLARHLRPRPENWFNFHDAWAPPAAPAGDDPAS